MGYIHYIVLFLLKGDIMRISDLRVLCTAISFATVAAQNNTNQGCDVEKINTLAGLFEKYCRLNLPEAFEAEQ